MPLNILNQNKNHLSAFFFSFAVIVTVLQLGRTLKEIGYCLYAGTLLAHLDHFLLVGVVRGLNDKVYLKLVSTFNSLS